MSTTNVTEKTFTVAISGCSSRIVCNICKAGFSRSTAVIAATQHASFAHDLRTNEYTLGDMIREAWKTQEEYVKTIAR